MKNFRLAFSALLIVAGSSLAMTSRETLAGILFIVLGLFIEMAAFTINQQDPGKE